mgnify:CR=1 FL=1
MAKRASAPENESQKDNPNVGAADLAEAQAVVESFRQLESELDRIAKEKESLHEQLLRTMADMQNYKRRVEQERQAIQLRAAEGVVRDLLPVLDSFDRTLAAAAKGASLESMLEGVKGVDRQLRSVLEARRLSRVATVGEKFDENVHEAILVDAESDLPEGTIVEELEAGYRLGDQVLRPARVKVAKGLG